MVRAEHCSAASHATVMQTLGGFPYLPTMVRAEHCSAASHATVMESLGGFPYPRHLPPALPPTRFARPRTMVRAEHCSAASYATEMAFDRATSEWLCFFPERTDTILHPNRG